MKMEQFTEFYQLTKPIEVVNPTSSVEKIYGPYPTMEEALSELSLLGLKGRQFTLVAENGEVDLYLYQENLEPKLVTKSYRVFDSDTDGLVPKSTTATASMYLNGVGQWSTPPNTTYSSGSLSTLNDTPTNTTNRIWSASILNQWLDSKNFITEYTDTTYATFTKDVGGLVPAPTGATSTRYLREDGTWVIPTNSTYSAITTTEYNTIVSGTATSTSVRLITPKMLQDVVDNANFNKAKKLSTPVNINGIPFDGSEDITIPVGDNGEVYNVFNSTTNGLVPTPNETNATKFLRADGSWVVPTNTTYNAGTIALLDVGTDTSNRVWSAKILTDWLNSKNFLTSYTDTTYQPFTKEINGLVPAPTGTTSTRFLREDGTWTVPTNTTYSLTTQANIDTGTETTGRLWSVKLMVDNFAKKNHTHTEYSPINHTHSNYLNSKQSQPNADIKQKYNVGISGWYDNAINAPSAYGTLLSFTNDGEPHNNSSNWLCHLLFEAGGSNRLFYGSKTNNESYVGPYEIYTSKNEWINDAVNKRHSHGANIPLIVGLVDAISVQPSYNFYYNNATEWTSRLVSLGVNTLQLGHNQSGGRFEFYNGNVYAPAYFTTSLRGYKTNIKEYIENALPLVESLKICTFDRKDSEQENIVGVIADETNPRFLNKELTAVDNYSTMFLMVKAIQELSEEVKQLKQQLNGK